MTDANRLLGSFDDLSRVPGAGGALQAVAQQTVSRVLVRSSFSAPLNIDPWAKTSEPAQPGAGGVTEWLLGRSKLAVTIFDKQGNVVYEWAPNGIPDENYVPHAAAAGAGAFAIVALLLGNVGVAKVAGAAALGFLGYGEAKNRGLL